jgi:hypothetical protein
MAEYHSTSLPMANTAWVCLKEAVFTKKLSNWYINLPARMQLYCQKVLIDVALHPPFVEGQASIHPPQF